MSKFPKLTEEEIGLYLQAEHENFWIPPKPRPVKEVIGDWMDDHPVLFKLFLFAIMIWYIVMCFMFEWIGILTLLAIPIAALGVLFWTLVNEAADAIRGWFD